MTCICYGSDHYEGYSAPLAIHKTVDEAKEWWSNQATLRHQGKESEGYHDCFCIAEFADDGRVFHYERDTTGGMNRQWYIRETKES